MAIAVRAKKRDDVCEFVCELLRMGSQEGLYEGVDKGTLGVVVKEKHLHPFLWEGNTQTTNSYHFHYFYITAWGVNSTLLKSEGA